VPGLDAPEQEIRISVVAAPDPSAAAAPLDIFCSFEFIPVQPRMKVSRKRRIETLRVSIITFLLMVDLHILCAD